MPSASTLSPGTDRAKASALPFSPRLCLGVLLPLGHPFATLQTTAHPAGMEDMTQHHEHQGWVTVTPSRGVARRGWARGRMRGGGGRCHLPGARGWQITTRRVVPPLRTGLTAPSVTRRDRHHDESFHPLPRLGTRWGPILPRLQICRGKDCQARGWDGSSRRLSGSGSRLSPRQPLISHRSRAERGHRLCRSGAGPTACPKAPRELRDGGDVFPPAQTPGS